MEKHSLVRASANTSSRRTFCQWFRSFGLEGTPDNAAMGRHGSYQLYCGLFGVNHPWQNHFFGCWPSYWIDPAKILWHESLNYFHHACCIYSIGPCTWWEVFGGNGVAAWPTQVNEITVNRRWYEDVCKHSSVHIILYFIEIKNSSGLSVVSEKFKYPIFCIITKLIAIHDEETKSQGQKNGQDKPRHTSPSVAGFESKAAWIEIPWKFFPCMYWPHDTGPPWGYVVFSIHIYNLMFPSSSFSLSLGSFPSRWSSLSSVKWLPKDS